MPLAGVAIQRGKEAELRSALREIRGAIDAYKSAGEQGSILVDADASGYPPDLRTLVAGVVDARSPKGVKLYFLRRIPRDPFFPDGSAPAEQTWGLRSHSSPPDRPEPGVDVFDVHSFSNQRGLNGVPYHEW